MRASRSALLIVAAIIALPAIAVDSARKAVLLPEVQKHLSDGRSDLALGRFEMARAHADVILIGDEVKYTVKFESGVPDRIRDKCEIALQEALNRWSDALDHSVRFVPVNEPDAAAVQVRFKRDVVMGDEPVAGFANWKRRIQLDGDRVLNTSVTADLQIRTVNLDGRTMPSAAMTHEIMHEMGHVLGLEDRDRVGELMGPLDVSRPVPGPLDFEVDAVVDLRSEARRLRQQALARR